SQRNAWCSLFAVALQPTICPASSIPNARLIPPPRSPKSVIWPPDHRSARAEPVALKPKPATWPASLMSRACPHVNPTGVPRSVKVPFSHNHGRNALPDVLPLHPTICPALLTPLAYTGGPPRVPRSVIVPWSQRNPRRSPFIVPPIWPLSLIAKADASGCTPGSVMTTFSSRTAHWYTDASVVPPPI